MGIETLNGYSEKENIVYKYKLLAVVTLLTIAVQPSFADNHGQIIGVWKMVSFEWEIKDSGDRVFPWGMTPTGYLIYTPEGRMMTITTKESREPPVTTQDRANLFNSMSASTGMYNLEEDKLVIKIDNAWDPALIGTERISFIKFDGDRLQVTSDWMPAGAGSTGSMGRSIITWERVK